MTRDLSRTVTTRMDDSYRKDQTPKIRAEKKILDEQIRKNRDNHRQVLRMIDRAQTHGQRMELMREKNRLENERRSLNHRRSNLRR